MDRTDMLKVIKINGLQTEVAKMFSKANYTNCSNAELETFMNKKGIGVINTKNTSSCNCTSTTTCKCENSKYTELVEGVAAMILSLGKEVKQDIDNACAKLEAQIR